MQKIWKTEQIQNFGLPKLVVSHMVENVGILNIAWGEDRDPEKVGGYLILIQKDEDLNEVTNLSEDPIGEILADDVFEYVENLEGYIIALRLFGDDYGVVFYVPESVRLSNKAELNLKKWYDVSLLMRDGANNDQI